MHSGPRKILPLSAKDVSQVRSTVQISSLIDVLKCLIKNSLDAGASFIHISCSFSEGRCVVEDNGCGIPEAEFEQESGLFQPYYTSKSGIPGLHGCYGISLSAIAALAVITISSHESGTESLNSITARFGQKPVTRTRRPLLQELDRIPTGTKVAVRNLFGEMPVRVLQRASSDVDDVNSRDWKLLKRETIALLLAWTKLVALKIQDHAGNIVLNIHTEGLIHHWHSNVQCLGKTLSTDLERVISILHQSEFIRSGPREPWIPVSGVSTTVSLNGLISLKPAPSKRCQFISFGVTPVANCKASNDLFEEINHAFSNSQFGILDYDIGAQTKKGSDGFLKSKEKSKNKKMQASGKTFERWPIFYLQITLHQPMDEHMGVHVPCLSNNITFQAVSKLVRITVDQWLASHHFKPGGCRLKRKRERDKTVISCTSTDDVEREDDSLAPPSSRYASKAFTRSSRVKSSSLTARPVDLDRSRLRRVGSVCTGHTINACTAQPNSPNIASLTDSGCNNLQDSSAAVTVESRSDSNVAGYARDPSVVDDLEIWTHPFTLQKFVVNKISGLVRSREDDTRRKPALPTSTSLSQSSTSAFHHKDTVSHTWIQRMMGDWSNPVFQISERRIRTAATDFPEKMEMLNHTTDGGRIQASGHGRLTPSSLCTAEVISQLDAKFVLVQIFTDNSGRRRSSRRRWEVGKCLVVIDQHAADERCKLESLFHELLEIGDWPGMGNLTSNLGHLRHAKTLKLPKPMVFDISVEEYKLLTDHAAYFRAWGIVYELANLPEDHETSIETRIVVNAITPVIFERCAAHPKLVLDLLRLEIWSCNDLETCPHVHRAVDHLPCAMDGLGSVRKSSDAWLNEIDNCPHLMLDMLKSRACRSAIMFNDHLNIKECKDLVHKLARCALPLQCAHGRPSAIPLVDLDSICFDEFPPGLKGQQTLNVYKSISYHYRSYVSVYRKWKQS